MEKAREFKAPESGALQRLRQVRCIKCREAFGVRCIPPLFIKTYIDAVQSSPKILLLLKTSPAVSWPRTGSGTNARICFQANGLPYTSPWATPEWRLDKA
jgi:hypothetical protein